MGRFVQRARACLSLAVRNALCTYSARINCTKQKQKHMKNQMECFRVKLLPIACALRPKQQQQQKKQRKIYGTVECTHFLAVSRHINPHRVCHFVALLFCPVARGSHSRFARINRSKAPIYIQCDKCHNPTIFFFCLFFRARVNAISAMQKRNENLHTGKFLSFVLCVSISFVSAFRNEKTKNSAEAQNFLRHRVVQIDGVIWRECEYIGRVACVIRHPPPTHPKPTQIFSLRAQTGWERLTWSKPTKQVANFSRSDPRSIADINKLNYLWISVMIFVDKQKR